MTRMNRRPNSSGGGTPEKPSSGRSRVGSGTGSVPSRRTGSGGVYSTAGTHYAEHVSEAVAEEGVSSGRYLVGTLYVNPRKNVEAYVRCEGLGIDIRVDDEKSRNRSLHGDVVYVDIMPEADWLPWSAMMQEKLGLGEGEGDSTKGAKDGGCSEQDAAAHREREKTVQRLWVPQQAMIDEFAKKTKDKKEAAKAQGKEGAHPHPLEKKSFDLSLQPRAKVVGIREHKHVTNHVGNITLQNAPVPGQRLSDREQGGFFQPSDARFSKFYVPRTAFPEAFLNNPVEGLKQIYLCDLSANWPARSRLQQCGNIRTVGEFGSIATETEALLSQYNCNHQLYSDDAVEPLRQILSQFGVIEGATGEEGWCIPEEEIAKRRDLRNHRIFTIDPPNAKDLDDALHITPLTGPGEEGMYEIGVHIADVSFFLQPDTSLDKEAQHRATSVYLVQKVIPMLPAILCEQLCSLNPNVDRLAFSCIWKMNADGTLVDSLPWFGKTVIRSCAKLDYPTAQRMIDGEIPSIPDSSSNPDGFLAALPESIWECWRRPKEHPAHAVAKDVVNMHSIAMGRRQARLNNGALVLTNRKLTFILDDKGNPAETGTYTIRESNQLVEEYMLLANYLVAQELLLKFGQAAFIRNHGQPDASGMKGLQDVFQQLGYDMDVTSSHTVQASLNNVGRSANAETLRIVSVLLAKPMPEAQYVVAGDDPQLWQHYALAIPYYTHFTSPIRRYADVMVHRLLELSIRGAGDEELLKGPLAEQALESARNVATKCNEMKRASKDAQTRSDRVFFAVYLRNKPMTVPGYVVGVGEKSFTVLVPEYGVEERLFVDNMSGVSYSWDSSAKILMLARPANNPNDQPKMKTDLPNMLSFIGNMEIKMLAPVLVHLSAKLRPPIDVGMSLVGPDPSGGGLSSPAIAAT